MAHGDTASWRWPALPNGATQTPSAPAMFQTTAAPTTATIVARSSDIDRILAHSAAP
jgi:hypothetical protein